LARLLKDPKLDTREARRRLKIGRAPHWRSIERGKSLGYRKSASGASWVARSYIGAGRYAEHRIGSADDTLDSDGMEVLSWPEAQRRAHEWFNHITTVEAGEHQLHADSLTVGDALESYLEWYRPNRKAYQDTKYNVEAHIRPALGHVEIRRLTKVRIERWHRELAVSPARVRTRSGERQKFAMRPSEPDAIRSRKVTANRILAILKAALNRSYDDRGLATPPVWMRVDRFKNVDDARPRFLDHTEALRLVTACQPTFRPLVQAALVSGGRYGELSRLKVHDYQHGKLHIRDSKSGKSRWIALTKDGRSLFDTLTTGRPPNEVMFLKLARSRKADGQRFRAWGKNHQQEPMAHACEGASIEPLGFHQLRHTYASLSVMSGMPLLVLAHNLGHKDTRMVEKHYAHLLPSYEDEMIERHAPKFDFGESSKIVAFRK
jgi:integrase